MGSPVVNPDYVKLAELPGFDRDSRNIIIFVLVAVEWQTDLHTCAEFVHNRSSCLAYFQYF